MTVKDGDKFLVNRSSQSFHLNAEDMSKLRDDDLLIVSRGGQAYKATGADIKGSLQPVSVSPPAVIAPPDGAGLEIGAKSDEITKVESSIGPRYSDGGANIFRPDNDLTSPAYISTSGVWWTGIGSDAWTNVYVVARSEPQGPDGYEDHQITIVPTSGGPNIQLVRGRKVKSDLYEFSVPVDKIGTFTGVKELTSNGNYTFNGNGYNFLVYGMSLVSPSEDNLLEDSASTATLTVAGDKDFTGDPSFKTGDRVEQDSGYTPQTSAVIDVLDPPLPTTYEGGGYNSITAFTFSPSADPVPNAAFGAFSKSYDGVVGTPPSSGSSFYIHQYKLNNPGVVSFVRFPSALPDDMYLIWYSDTGGNTDWVFDKAASDLSANTTGIPRYPSTALSGSGPHKYWQIARLASPEKAMYLAGSGTGNAVETLVDNYGVGNAVQKITLTLTDGTDLENFRVNDVETKGNTVLVIKDPDLGAPYQMTLSGGSWSNGETVTGPDTTPATGTLASAPDPATKTMVLSNPDESGSKRWIVNQGKYVEGEKFPSGDAATSTTPSCVCTDPVVMNGTFASTTWQVATDKNFANVVAASNNNPDATRWTVSPPLANDTKHWVRAEHKATDGTSSGFGPVNEFKTEV